MTTHATHTHSRYRWLRMVEHLFPKPAVGSTVDIICDNCTVARTYVDPTFSDVLRAWARASMVHKHCKTPGSATAQYHHEQRIARKRVGCR